jgi:hypothetical protein
MTTTITNRPRRRYRRDRWITRHSSDGVVVGEELLGGHWLICVGNKEIGTVRSRPIAERICDQLARGQLPNKESFE